MPPGQRMVDGRAAVGFIGGRNAGREPDFGACALKVPSENADSFPEEGDPARQARRSNAAHAKRAVLAAFEET